MVVQRGGQWPAAAKPRGDGGGQVAGVAQRVGHALRRDRVHDDAGVPGQRPAGPVRAPERVGLVGRGAQPLRPAAAADTLPQIAARVERAQVMALQVRARRRELGHRRRRIDHGELVVGGEDRHRAARPLVELTTQDWNRGPIGIAGKRPHRPLAVPPRADRAGYQRPFTVGPDHQARGLGHGRAAAGIAPYPGDPAA
jgi:hypothetical protein